MNDFRYAICNETFQDWPFEKAFAYAAELGYTGMEIAPFTLNKDAALITSAQKKEVCNLAAKYQLEIVGLHWLLAFTEGYYLTTSDAAVRKKTAEYLCLLSELCAELGGRVMVLGSPKQRNLLPGITHEQALKYAADVLSQVDSTLERTGVQIAIEPLGPQEGDFLLTAKSGIELINLVNSPRIQLHLDVKAMSSELTPIPQIICESQKHTIHFHANDANRRGPGMGEIDFVPIMKALRDTDYRGWVSVEVFDYEPGVETLASESIMNLKKAAAISG